MAPRPPAALPPTPCSRDRGPSVDSSYRGASLEMGGAEGGAAAMVARRKLSFAAHLQPVEEEGEPHDPAAAEQLEEGDMIEYQETGAGGGKVGGGPPPASSSPWH